MSKHDLNIGDTIFVKDGVAKGNYGIITSLNFETYGINIKPFGCKTIIWKSWWNVEKVNVNKHLLEGIIDEI